MWSNLVKNSFRFGLVKILVSTWLCLFYCEQNFVSANIFADILSFRFVSISVWSRLWFVLFRFGLVILYQHFVIFRFGQVKKNLFWFRSRNFGFRLFLVRMWALFLIGSLLRPASPQQTNKLTKEIWLLCIGILISAMLTPKKCLSKQHFTLW